MYRVRGFVVAAWVLVCLWAPLLAAQQHYDLSSWIPKPTSYIQVRYTDRDPGPDMGAIRRFKLMLDGGQAKVARYHIQLIYKTNNLSPTDDRIFLQDAFLRFHGGPLLWTVGQFKPPFGLERFQPDRMLDFVDRTASTSRLVVNGRLGESFARDRGAQMDYTRKGFRLSLGLFQGGGANNDQKGNGPLGVLRLQYTGRGNRTERTWYWEAGVAGSARRAEDLDLRGQLTGLPWSRIEHFNGYDHRLDLFIQGGWGRFRGQAELYRAWFDPRAGASWAAKGAYAQGAYLPVNGLILALRTEWMTPDVDAMVPSVHNWTVAVTYDVPGIPLRLSSDYAWYVGNSSRMAHMWRLQIQYVLLGGVPATH